MQNPTLATTHHKPRHKPRSDDDYNDDRRKRHRRTFWFILVAAVWILLGAMAYVSAFNCTHERYTGGDARKIGMLILAGLLGPFYWIIHPFVRADGYCNLK